MAEPAIALRVSGLSRHFGGVPAIDDLTLDVRSGETLGIIGPNGAGKSTLVGLISGALPPSSGRIELYGREVTQLRSDARTRLGVGRTHQIPRPFARMSVRENVALAARHARTAPSRHDLQSDCDRILARTGLADVADTVAGALPLLRRKRLELARALALQPRLLLLDEIGAGLIESETRELIALIQSLRAEVDAIVLIEHVMDVITACCDRTAVLASGKLLKAGDTHSMLRDAEVAAIYLGTHTATPLTSAAPWPAAAAAAVAETTAAATATAATAPALLELRNVAVHYGGVRALRGVSMELRAGEALALLGANGAGKTTLARAISGVVPLAGGSIHFDGQPLAGLRPDQITRLGIGHCMEGRRIFAALSVEENLRLALPGSTPAVQAARLEEIYALFPVLRERRERPGTAMSGGQQQMLAIARALMPSPRLLLFDEISLGLAPIAVEEIYRLLAQVRASGVAMLVVEQNIERGLALADRACVLSHGEALLQGTPTEVRTHPELRALYVGR